MEAHQKPAKYCSQCVKIWKFTVCSQLLYRTVHSVLTTVIQNSSQCAHNCYTEQFTVCSQLLYRTVHSVLTTVIQNNLHFCPDHKKAIVLLSAWLQPIYYLSYFIYLVTQIPEYCSLQLHLNILQSSEDKKASYCGNQSSHIEEKT